MFVEEDQRLSWGWGCPDHRYPGGTSPQLHEDRVGHPFISFLQGLWNLNPNILQIFKLEHYFCPPFSVPPFPNLLFILMHFVSLGCAGQAECLVQLATISNQFFNIATCSYLKNKWERSILKLCTQKTRLMSCNPNTYRNSPQLSALMAPKIQSHPVKCLMFHFWELNPRTKEEKPQHGALCTRKYLSFQRGYLEHHRNKPDSTIANG